jgi:hypothetical protein
MYIYIHKLIPMKRNTISLIAASVLCLFLASCSSVRQSTAFSERKYFNFKHHNPVVVFDKKKNETHQDIASLPVAQQKQVVLAGQPNSLTVVAAQPVACIHKQIGKRNNVALAVAKKSAVVEQPAKQERISSATASSEMASLSEHGGGGDVSTNTILLVILAIFVAPLAVYLYDNAATTRFVIVLVLWILGVFGFYFIFFWLALLAAIIYAILIVTGSV